MVIRLMDDIGVGAGPVRWMDGWTDGWMVGRMAVSKIPASRSLSVCTAQLFRVWHWRTASPPPLQPGEGRSMLLRRVTLTTAYRHCFKQKWRFSEHSMKAERRW